MSSLLLRTAGWRQGEERTGGCRCTLVLLRFAFNQLSCVVVGGLTNTYMFQEKQWWDKSPPRLCAHGCVRAKLCPNSTQWNQGSQHIPQRSIVCVSSFDHPHPGCKNMFMCTGATHACGVLLNALQYPCARVFGHTTRTHCKHPTIQPTKTTDTQRCTRPHKETTRGDGAPHKKATTKKTPTAQHSTARHRPMPCHKGGCDASLATATRQSKGANELLRQEAREGAK